MYSLAEILDNLDSRQLNLEKIFKLSSENKDLVMGLYRDLITSINGDKGFSLPGGYKCDIINASIILRTLIDGDYLVTTRESKINKILNDDK